MKKVGDDTHKVQNTSTKSGKLTDDFACLDVDKTNDQVIAGQSEQAAISL